MEDRRVEQDCTEYEKQWEEHKKEIVKNMDILKHRLIKNQNYLIRYISSEFEADGIVYAKVSQNQEIINTATKNVNLENQIKRLEKFLYCKHEFISTGYQTRTQTYYKCDKCGRDVAVDVNNKLLF